MFFAYFKCKLRILVFIIWRFISIIRLAIFIFGLEIVVVVIVVVLVRVDGHD